MEVVPAVVRAVKGYSTADGKQIPLENALLIIAQGTAEHSPYNPGTADKPVIPEGNMLWGVTSDSKKPGATVKTRTDEVKDGKRVSEANRSFRSYDTMEEAAVGYLRALEGTDPDAAKNENYKQVLDVLTKPGATPEGLRRRARQGPLRDRDRTTASTWRPTPAPAGAPRRRG